MATVGISFSLRVHAGVTVQGYLDNTIVLHRRTLHADSFTVALLEQSRIGDDNWYQACARITPLGLRQNLHSFRSQLEALLCADPNIVVVSLDEPR